MQTSHKVLVAVLSLAVVAVAGVGVDRYTTRPKPVPQPSVAQVESQKNQALSQLAVQKAADAGAIQGLNVSNSALTGQKAQLCAEIAHYRLTSPDCK